jgi:flagellar assembly protein FliH
MIMFDPSLQAISVLDARAEPSPYRPTMRHGIPAVSQASAIPETTAWDEGRMAAAQEWEDERSAMLTLIAAAQALQPEPSEELAALIAETVLLLVSDIVGQVEVDRDGLLRRAKRAAAQIGECDNARVLLAHPQDVALLADANLSLTIMADPLAEPGSIRIDCSPGWIEHGTSIYLDSLRSELGLAEREL